VGERAVTLNDLAGIAAVASPSTLNRILQALHKPSGGFVPPSLQAPAAILGMLLDIRRYVADVFGTRPEAFADLTTSATRQFNETHRTWNACR